MVYTVYHTFSLWCLFLLVFVSDTDRTLEVVINEKDNVQMKLWVTATLIVNIVNADVLDHVMKGGEGGALNKIQNSQSRLNESETKPCQLFGLLFLFLSKSKCTWCTHQNSIQQRYNNF